MSLSNLEQALKTARNNRGQDFSEEEVAALAASPESWRDNASQVYLVMVAQTAGIGEYYSSNTEKKILAQLRQLRKAQNAPLPPEIVKTLKEVLEVATELNPTAHLGGFMQTRDDVIEFKKFLEFFPAASETSYANKAIDALIRNIGTGYVDNSCGTRELENLITAYMKLGDMSKASFRSRLPAIVEHAIEKKDHHLAAVAAKGAAYPGKADLKPFIDLVERLKTERNTAFANFYSTENKRDELSGVKRTLGEIATNFKVLYFDFGKQLPYTIEDEIIRMVSLIANPELYKAFYNGSVKRMGFDYVSCLSEGTSEAKGTNTRELLTKQLKPETIIQFRNKLIGERVYIEACGRFGGAAHSFAVESLQKTYRAAFSEELPIPTPSQISEMKARIENSNARRNSNSNL